MREKLPDDARELLAFFIKHNGDPRDARHHRSGGMWVGCSGFSRFSGDLLYQSYAELRLLRDQAEDRREYLLGTDLGPVSRVMLCELPLEPSSAFIPDPAPPPVRWQSPTLADGNAWLSRMVKGQGSS